MQTASFQGSLTLQHGFKAVPTCKSAYTRCKLPPTICPVTEMTIAACFAGGSSYPKSHKEEKKMAVKVSLSFGKFSDVELDNFAQGVIDAMTGNATYPFRYR